MNKESGGKGQRREGRRFVHLAFYIKTNSFGVRIDISLLFYSPELTFRPLASNADFKDIGWTKSQICYD